MSRTLGFVIFVMTWIVTEQIYWLYLRYVFLYVWLGSTFRGYECIFKNIYGFVHQHSLIDFVIIKFIKKR